jgi:hypothetical protein
VSWGELDVNWVNNMTAVAIGRVGRSNRRNKVQLEEGEELRGGGGGGAGGVQWCSMLRWEVGVSREGWVIL